MGPGTPSWRVFDEPQGQAGPALPRPSGDRGGGSPVDESASGRIRMAAILGAALAAGLVAIFAALSSGSGGEVVVARASDAFAPSASPAAEGSGATEGSLVVEIVGAVVHPGVYRLSAGARVGDLVAAAGGYGARVDTTLAERRLNLAQPLRDGDQVRVPSRDDPPEGQESPGIPGGVDANGSTPAAPGPLDLNTATAEQLDTLPGIGPVTAAKILAARDEAPFAVVDDLRSRGLVGEKTFERLRDAVTVR